MDNDFPPMTCTEDLIHPADLYADAKAALDHEAKEWWNHTNWWHYKYGVHGGRLDHPWGAPDNPESGYAQRCGYLNAGYWVYGHMRCTNGLIHPAGAYDQVSQLLTPLE